MTSKRAVRRRECGSKRRYAARADADLARGGLFRRTGDRLDSYRCKWCHGWHTGHAPMAVQVRLGRVS